MNLFRRKTLKRGVGPLSILAVILGVSCILRLAGGTGQAIAKEVGNIRSGANGLSEPQSCEPPPDVATVLDALEARESQLEEREAYHATRSSALAEAQKEIERQLAALVAAEQALEETLALADNAAEDDIGRLTTVYENMKPKEAARLFETMAPAFAAGFLGRMRPDAAAKVVEGLSPEVAYSISVILAGRNADVPKN